MFFFPLRDDNPTSKTPWVNWVIIALCCFVFLVQLSQGSYNEVLIKGLGVTPAVLFGQNYLPFEYQFVPSWATVLTSMFLHGGIMHLLGNMLYLWIFGDNIEDCVGSKFRYISLYVCCGIAAAFAQSLVDPNSMVPMIGASGAIAGMLGAYLILHPRANIICLIGFFVFFRTVNVPAFLVLGGWIGLQFLNLGQVDSGVAYVAHIGGFVAGVILIPFFKQAHVPLFDKSHSKAFRIDRVQSKDLAKGLHVPSMPRKSKETSSTDDKNKTNRHPWA